MMIARTAQTALIALTALTGNSEHARPYVRAGEELVYAVSSQRLGKMGNARFAVTPTELNGHSAFELSFDFQTKVVFFKVSNHSRSWLCSESLGMMKYTKEEHSPLGGQSEAAAADPTEGRLDELSFIYLVRGLDLAIGDSVTLHRHFDPRRNPVQIRALAKQSIDGKDVVVYQMDVPDAHQKSGRSTLRFYVTDDAARLPLRIESTMPMAGQVTMTLTSAQILPSLAAR